MEPDQLGDFGRLVPGGQDGPIRVADHYEVAVARQMLRSAADRTGPMPSPGRGSALDAGADTEVHAAWTSSAAPGRVCR